MQKQFKHRPANHKRVIQRQIPVRVTNTLQEKAICTFKPAFDRKTRKYGYKEIESWICPITQIETAKDESIIKDIEHTSKQIALQYAYFMADERVKLLRSKGIAAKITILKEAIRVTYLQNTTV